MKEYQLNLSKDIERKVMRRTVELLHKWCKHKGFKFDDSIKGKIKADFEKVKNYSVKIYTVRYDGVLVLRRFNDIYGTDFRFEVYY